MFSGGVFLVKCALKEQLTITFAEYLINEKKKYHFFLLNSAEADSQK